VTPELRQRAAQLYGTPDEGANELAGYSDDQLEFLTAFLRGSVSYQEERMRRLEAIKAGEAGEATSPATSEASEGATTE
jgi:hypothetical protein